MKRDVGFMAIIVLLAALFGQLVLLLVPEQNVEEHNQQPRVTSVSTVVDTDGDTDADEEENGASTVAVKPPVLPDDVYKKIMYGENRSTDNDAAVEAPEIPLGDCYGEFRVKMKSGYRLERAKGVTRVVDENGKEDTASDALVALDKDFPEAAVELLWGEKNREKLLALKKRGENITGRTLPDLMTMYMDRIATPSDIIETA